MKLNEPRKHYLHKCPHPGHRMFKALALSNRLNEFSGLVEQKIVNRESVYEATQYNTAKKYM